MSGVNTTLVSLKASVNAAFDTVTVSGTMAPGATPSEVVEKLTPLSGVSSETA